MSRTCNGKPELSDGFSRISNEYLEALYRDSDVNMKTRIRLYIQRWTWGFDEKMKEISVRQMMRDMGVEDKHRRTVFRSLHDLAETRRIEIVRSSADKRKLRIGINKYYQQWKTEIVRTGADNKKAGDCPHQCGQKRAKIADNLEAAPYMKESIKRKNSSVVRLRFDVPVTIPTHFAATPEMITYAKKKGIDQKIDIKDWTEQFILRCQSKGYKYRDWGATWKSWLLNDFKKLHDNKKADDRAIPTLRETEWSRKQRAERESVELYQAIRDREIEIMGGDYDATRDDHHQGDERGLSCQPCQDRPQDPSGQGRDSCQVSQGLQPVDHQQGVSTAPKSQQLSTYCERDDRGLPVRFSVYG